MSNNNIVRFEAGKSYIMPVHFGLPRESADLETAHYEDNISYTIRFATDKKLASALLPQGMSIPDAAIVSVSYVNCNGVYFMAGRSYNLISVNLSARFNGQQESIDGIFNLVLWENDFYPIVLGREVLGAPKLFADIPDIRLKDRVKCFSATEYGSLFLEGKIWDLVKMSDADCKKIEKMNNNLALMGWKYISSCNGLGADFSKATLQPFKTELKEAWAGKGSIEFLKTTWERAPLSSHIINKLAELPVEKNLGALVTRGSQDLLIRQQRTLE